MFAKSHRLTTKDVRYIQKQRNVIWTQHFGVLWIPQYANKRFHQVSLYIAADTVKKASRRHALKRKLLEYLQSQILPQQ
jgi:RNase P protein component